MRWSSRRRGWFSLLVAALLCAGGWLWFGHSASDPEAGTLDRNVRTDHSVANQPRLVGRAMDSGTAAVEVPEPSLGPVHGRVVTQEAVPLRGVRVRASPGQEALTDGSGRFALTGAVHSLSIDATGFQPRIIDLGMQDAPNGRDLGDIVLVPDARCHVRVACSGGHPVVGKPVDWSFPRSRHEVLNPRRNPLTSESAWHTVGLTDASGTCLARVPGGREVVFRAVVDDVPVLSAVVRPGEDDTVRITIPRLHDLRVIARLTRSGEAIGPIRVTKTDGPPQARWSRLVSNELGHCDLRLPSGAYEVSALAAGGRLLHRRAVVPGTEVVHLELEAVQRLRVRVTGAGKPLPAFNALAHRGKPPPGTAGYLLFSQSPVHGRDGEVIISLPFGTGAPAGDHVWLLVGAPGWLPDLLRVPWDARELERDVSVDLLPAPSVKGRLPEALLGGDALRFYARAVKDWGTWDHSQAPLLATSPLSAGGRFAFGSLGPGIYEIRMTWAGREVTVASCTIEEHGEATIAVDEPATLILELPAGHETGSLPVLYRRQETAGWSFGGNYEETEITGTRYGAELRFSPLTPGIYAIVRSDLAGDRFALAMAAEHVTIRAGEVLTQAWSANAVRTFVVRVETPPDGTMSSFAVGFVPASRTPVNLQSMTWTTCDAEGKAEWTSGEEGPGYLTVVSTASTDDPARASSPAPLAVSEVPAGDARVDLRIASPARLRVAGEPSQIIVLIHPLLSRVAGYYPRLSADELSPPLMPGRWRVEWHEPGGGMVRSTELDLAPGDDRYVRHQAR